MSVYPVTVDGSRDPVMEVFHLLIKAWQAVCCAKDYVVQAWQVLMKMCDMVLQSTGLYEWTSAWRT